MDAAHLHLALNHAPLFGLLFAVLGLAWAFVRSNHDLARASLSLVVLAGVLVLPVYLSGEDAEDVVETQIGVSEVAIEAHEDAALGAAVATGAVAVLALLLLIAYRAKPVSRPVVALMLLLTVGTVGWIGYVANLGGQINHPEIRGDTAVQTSLEHDDD